jgi:hypothetical protein
VFESFFFTPGFALAEKEIGQVLTMFFVDWFQIKVCFTTVRVVLPLKPVNKD